MDKFNLREYLKNNPLLKEEKTLVDALIDELWYVSSFDFAKLTKKMGEYDLWKSADGDIDGINNMEDRVEIVSQNFDEEDAKRYLNSIKKANVGSSEFQTSKKFEIELTVPVVYHSNNELYSDKNTYYTDAELEDGVDQTSYTSGEELDNMIFSNDYDTAKEFEKNHPGLFKVV